MEQRQSTFQIGVFFTLWHMQTAIIELDKDLKAR